MSQIINFISSLGAPFNMIVTICLIFALTSVVGGLIAVVGSVVRHREDTQFKRELLDRGMTIDEIERLIQLRQKKEDE